MKTTEFALFNAKPEFDRPLPVGQLYFPSWDRYESAFRGIFERQYYNNNGPLHEELESKLQKLLGSRHVICVSNATLGLMMTADAMELKGKVILPAFTFIASAQSLAWTKLEPVFCDVDPETHQIDIDQASSLIDKDVSAIMGVNLWGGSCNPKDLAKLADAHNIQLYFDSAHAFGCSVDNVPIGNFGSAEVFSFHATKILNATEGGCICTNDSDLAARLRTIRPSYGDYEQVPISRVANARMSEAQAAIALMSLEDFPANRENNQKLYRIYEAKLALIPGVNMVKSTGVSISNYQYVVCTIDEKKFGISRDVLRDVLKAENVLARRYFYPGLHRTVPFVHEFPDYQNRLPKTDTLCASSIQFPIGALVSAEDVERICDIINRAHQYSSTISSQYE